MIAKKSILAFMMGALSCLGYPQNWLTVAEGYPDLRHRWEDGA
jgi:hypothetical protein